MAHMSATPMRRDTADGAALVTTPAGAVNEVGRTAMAESMSVCEMKILRLSSAMMGRVIEK